MKKGILYSALCLSGTALLASESEGQAALTQEGTGYKEITIRIGGSRALTAALLDAAAKGVTVTGIAGFDSLSAVYGLMGIYRKGVSSGFYGHRLRLRFPPDSDVAEITGAYRNLPYITGRLGAVVSKKREAGVGRKLVYGMLGGTVCGLVGALTLFPLPTGGDGIGAAAGLAMGFAGGNVVGTAIGVSVAGEGLGFPGHFAGSALLGVGVPVAALAHLEAGKMRGTLVLLGGIAGPVIGATLALELGDRYPPTGDRKNSRFSLGLAPNLQQGLSASAILHF